MTMAEVTVREIGRSLSTTSNACFHRDLAFLCNLLYRNISFVGELDAALSSSII